MTDLYTSVLEDHTWDGRTNDPGVAIIKFCEGWPKGGKPYVCPAINIAADFQAKIANRNGKDKTKIKLQYRVGINMDDVVKQGARNLMGEGVSNAAGLESLA